MNQDSYLSLLIANNVFWYLAIWTLLFVVVYTLNSMLRERLGGVTILFKAIYLAIVGLMFVLTCGEIGVASYNIWTQTEAGDEADAFPIVHPAEQLRLAYNVMYFLSVIASGALSLMTIFALRSKLHPLGVSYTQTAMNEKVIFTNRKSGPHSLGQRPLLRHGLLDSHQRRLLCLVSQ